MRVRFKRSLIVGKFAPLHVGHLHLIHTAMAESFSLTILVYANPDFPDMPQQLRVEWIRETIPSADVRAPQNPPPDSADDHTHRLFVRDYLVEQAIEIDAVFTSEDYGDGFAAVLGVAHRIVDRRRLVHPISGTLLRSNLHRHKVYLCEPARRHFMREPDAEGSSDMVGDDGLEPPTSSV